MCILADAWTHNLGMYRTQGQQPVTSFLQGTVGRSCYWVVLSAAHISALKMLEASVFLARSTFECLLNGHCHDQ